MSLFNETPAKLILNRRAIATGIAALLGAPAVTAATLKQLSNVPLGFDADAFSGMMNGDLFLPDYRAPMVRLLFDDGSATGWHRYNPGHTRKKGVSYGGHVPTHNTKAVALECCAPDNNGAPRYMQLAIG